MLFPLFTFTKSAAVNLDQVYPPELFPTDLLNGLSRVGSAIGTFLPPLSLDGIGFSPTMLVLTLVLLSWPLWAPETKNAGLD